MKDIKTFIKESEKKSVFNDIADYAEAWIDYMYNEGVIDYDDRHLVEYSKNKKTPDFKDIVKGILDEYSSKITEETKNVLNKYLKDKNPKKNSPVEHAILAAIEKFVEEGNCEEMAKL